MSMTQMSKSQASRDIIRLNLRYRIRTFSIARSVHPKRVLEDIGILANMIYQNLERQPLYINKHDGVDLFIHIAAPREAQTLRGVQLISKSNRIQVRADLVALYDPRLDLHGYFEHSRNVGVASEMFRAAQSIDVDRPIKRVLDGGTNL
jgi:hypothetical protein